MGSSSPIVGVISTYANTSIPGCKYLSSIMHIYFLICALLSAYADTSIVKNMYHMCPFKHEKRIHQIPTELQTFRDVYMIYFCNAVQLDLPNEKLSPVKLSSCSVSKLSKTLTKERLAAPVCFLAKHSGDGPFLKLKADGECAIFQEKKLNGYVSNCPKNKRVSNKN